MTTSAAPDDFVEARRDLIIRTEHGKLLVAQIDEHAALRPSLQAARFVSVTGSARWVPQWDGDQLSAICLRLRLRCLSTRDLLVRSPCPRASEPSPIVRVESFS